MNPYEEIIDSLPGSDFISEIIPIYYPKGNPCFLVDISFICPLHPEWN
ncbi:hypothetical protein LCGC14_0414090 [marine sediment metagenome]|uniref:Uncharacterized protein n=1 Tax=marine sediment metagenome TaxID=412755 RepID=A0A0F9W222_9ZZZZ